MVYFSTTKNNIPTILWNKFLLKLKNIIKKLFKVIIVVSNRKKCIFNHGEENYFRSSSSTNYKQLNCNLSSEEVSTSASNSADSGASLDINNKKNSVAVANLPTTTETANTTTESNTKIIWVQNPLKLLTKTDNIKEGNMPSATLANLHPNNEECGIRDVWAHNLEDEFRTIRQIVQKYQYVAMDTEFPGVVARPIGEFRSSSDYQYQMLRCNVDLLRIIQLGLTFLDDNGKTPGGSYTTWQFNFKFNLQEDMYAQDSIDLLTNSGIQFKKHEDEGIEPLEFAELLMTSGIVLMDNIKWLSFHSGYDFGYLIKLLTDNNLPQDENDFFELLKLYFPTIYDVKYLMKSCKNLKGGLQEVAEQLDLERIGPQHQAGSDSLLTGMAFFKMKEMFFEDTIDDSKFSGHLYGLGTSFAVNGTTNNFPTDNGENVNSS